MNRRTVVAWDGSGPSETAVNWAAEREAFSGGHLVLSTVINDATVVGGRRDAAGTSDAIRRRLEDRAERLRLAHPGLYVTTELSWGDPYQELLSQSPLAVLLVVGTRRPEARTSRYGWSLGARLAATAWCPVAVIPEGVTGQEDRIVVGVDDDVGVSTAAARFAAMAAEGRGSDVHVVHAWTEPPATEATHLPDERFLSSLRAEHDRILQDATTPLIADFPALRIRTDLVHTWPAWALVERARGAALLVVGRRGFDKAQRLLLGTICHAVVLNAVSPTVVVGRRPDHE
jgi:nucleotide-binding universal stress UspA family protein